MGHLVSFHTYSYGKTVKEQNENRRMAEFEISEAYEYGSDNHSPCSGVNWFSDVVCEDEDSAEEWLENKAEKDRWYWRNEAGACLFKRYETQANSKSERLEKKIEVAKQKLSNEQTARENFINANKASNRKSTYVGCPKCGSKLHKDYIGVSVYYGTMACPLCHENLFSTTVKERIKKYDDDIKKYSHEIHDLEKAYEEALKTKKFNLVWLVRLEYHV